MGGFTVQFDIRDYNLHSGLPSTDLVTPSEGENEDKNTISRVFWINKFSHTVEERDKEG